MRALVCRKPGELALEDRAEPARSEGEALIGVSRVGICGTDFHIFEGSHPYLQYPRIMGHEISGEVLEAPPGAGLTRGQTVVVNPYISCGACFACRRGKPNCCMRIAVLGVHRDGGFCERISVPAGNVYPVSGIGVDAAASVEFLSIGAHAVARSGIASGSRALVIGAGPIGLGVALFAKLAGGEVTAMDRDKERLAFAEEIGIATGSIMAGDDAARRVDEATSGDGFEFVFDATGHPASMAQAFNYVSHGGALVLVSVVKDDIAFSDPEFHKREMTVMGSRNALRADFERVIAAIEAKRVPLDRLLSRRTDLKGAVTDLPRWTSNKKGLVKALVEIA